MNCVQAILTIFLANLIVLIPMVLNAHAGTKYGIPFPVYCRASFGVLGPSCPPCCRRWWRAVGLASSLDWRRGHPQDPGGIHPRVERRGRFAGAGDYTVAVP